MARYFFDTSALVKHYHAEAGTAAVDAIFAEAGAELLISRLAVVEVASALSPSGGKHRLKPGLPRPLR